MASFPPFPVQLTIWRVDDALRPVLIASVEEKGFGIGTCLWSSSKSGGGGAVAAGGGGGGARAPLLFYTLYGAGAADAPTTVKCSDDCGRSSVVQVSGLEGQPLIRGGRYCLARM